MQWPDPTIIEAASWRLASEFVRRHPTRTRLIRAFPGGGQYDVLWVLDTKGGAGDIRLNREGTIQVHGRFDGAPDIDWAPTSWDDYLRADPSSFLEQLERAAGLASPTSVPSVTPTSLTYRVFAALTATAAKSVHPITIDLGYIESSGMGGSGPNPLLDGFGVPPALRQPRADDLFGEAGYRFWIALRDRKPMFVIEQSSATAYFAGTSHAVDLMALYRHSRRDVTFVAASLQHEAATLK